MRSSSPGRLQISCQAMRDHRLELGVERCPVGEGAIDPGVAQHSAAVLNNGLEQRFRGVASLLSRGEEAAQGADQRRGSLDGREVGAVELHVARAGNGGHQLLAMAGEGRRDVALASDDQHRAGDARKPADHVHVADGGAGPGIALRRLGDEIALEARCDSRMPGCESGRQEALQGGVGDGSSAAGTHLRDAIPPDEAIHGCRGADQGYRRDALRVSERQFHRDHAAKRDAGDRGALDPGRVHDGGDVTGQHRQAVLAIRCIGGAVAARVDPQRAKRGEEAGHRRVPERHVGAD